MTEFFAHFHLQHWRLGETTDQEHVPYIYTELPLTLWRPLLPYGCSYKNPVPDRVKSSSVIFDIRTADAQGWLSVRVSGCQKVQMKA